MSFQELSFAPDKRSIQGLTFRFSERSTGGEFSPQESMRHQLSKIYEEKFATINQTQRSILVDILVPTVPLSHRNLPMLAAANYIVYLMRNWEKHDEITPEIFNKYLKYVPSGIVDTAEETLEEKISSAKFKITLLRYIYYIISYTK